MLSFHTTVQPRAALLRAAAAAGLVLVASSCKTTASPDASTVAAAGGDLPAIAFQGEACTVRDLGGDGEFDVSCKKDGRLCYASYTSRELSFPGQTNRLRNVAFKAGSPADDLAQTIAVHYHDLVAVGSREEAATVTQSLIDRFCGLSDAEQDRADEIRRSRSWGISGADKIYSKYHVVSASSCFKYDSGWGLSAQGQQRCGEEFDALRSTGEFQDYARESCLQACYEQLTKRCRGEN